MKKASRIITVCGIIFFIGLSVFSYLYWDTTISWPNIYNIDDLAKYFTHESDVWFPEVEVWNLTSQSTYELYTMDRITRRTKPSGYIITSTCDFDGSKCTVRVFFKFHLLQIMTGLFKSKRLLTVIPHPSIILPADIVYQFHFHIPPKTKLRPYSGWKIKFVRS